MVKRHYCRTLSATQTLCVLLAALLLLPPELRAAQKTDPLQPLIRSFDLLEKAREVALENLGQAEALVKEARKAASEVRRINENVAITVGAQEAMVKEFQIELQTRRKSLESMLDRLEHLVDDKQLHSAKQLLDALPSYTPRSDEKLPFFRIRGEVESQLQRAQAFLDEGDKQAARGISKVAEKHYEEAKRLNVELADFDELKKRAEERENYLSASQKRIRDLLDSRRLEAAHAHMESLQPQLPADEERYGFVAMQSEISRRRQEVRSLINQGDASLRAEPSDAIKLYKRAAKENKDLNMKSHIDSAELNERLQRKGGGSGRGLAFLAIFVAILVGAAIVADNQRSR